jgi:hypothetical protein
LEDDEPPRRLQLLHSYSHEEISDLISRLATTRR